METKLFIGSKEVQSFAEFESSGVKMVSVLFVSGLSDEMTQEEFDLVKSESPADDTATRDLKCKPIVSKLLVIFLTANTTCNESIYCLQKAASSLQESLQEADRRKWSGLDVMNVRLQVVDEMLKDKTDVKEEVK